MWISGVVGALGIWLMAAPAVLGYGPAAQTSDRIVGPILATLGFVAMAEATRPVVRAALAPGLWLLIAPLLLGYPADAAWNSVIVGVVASALSLLAARMDPAKFGGGWSVLWNDVLRRRMYQGE